MRSGHGDGDGVMREKKIDLPVGGGDDNHAVARVRRASAFAGHDAERFVEQSFQRFQHARDAVGIGVVDEMDAHAVR